MTTISSYSVGLALDASSYIRNSSLAGKETASLKRMINSSRSPADKYNRSLALLQKSYKAGAIDAATFNRLLDAQKAKLRSASVSTGSFTRSIAGAAAAYVSFGSAARVLTDGIKLAAKAEQMSIAFEVLTKDADVSAKLLTQLQGFAARTPFQQSEIMGAARSLLAFGFSADQIQTRLSKLGNISAATGTRIGELAEIIGKMNVQGVIMSEDLNQLAGRGINVFDGLAKRLGTTTDQVKKFASQGKISFQDLQAVLDDLADNDFAGMLNRQADSLAGKWSTFNDQLDQTKRLLGQIAVGDGNSMASVLGWAKRLNKALDVLAGSPEAKQKAADAEREAAEAQLRAIKLRKSVNMRGTESRVRDKMFANYIQRGGVGVTGEQVAGGLANSGSMAAKGLLAGIAELVGVKPEENNGKVSQVLMEGLGQMAGLITTNATVNTQRITQAVTTGSVQSIEAGTQEAYAFLTSSMDASLEQEKADRAKAKEQRERQIELQRSASGYLQGMMEIFADNPPLRKAR
jgi:tape measure domain-containing protein